MIDDGHLENEIDGYNNNDVANETTYLMSSQHIDTIRVVSSSTGTIIMVMVAKTTVVLIDGNDHHHHVATSVPYAAIFSRDVTTNIARDTKFKQKLTWFGKEGDNSQCCTVATPR
jgi:G:T-mismatch repair DNA endonuclease (very short patch repair protein)